MSRKRYRLAEASAFESNRVARVREGVYAKRELRGVQSHGKRGRKVTK